MKYQNINEARLGLDGVIKPFIGSSVNEESIHQAIKEWVMANFDLDENMQPIDEPNKIMLLQIRGVLYPRHIASGLGVGEFSKGAANCLRDAVGAANADVILKNFPYQPVTKDDHRLETTLRVRQLSDGTMRAVAKTAPDAAEKITIQRYTTINEGRRGLDALIKGLMSHQVKPDLETVNLAIRNWANQHFDASQDKTVILQIRGVLYPRHIADGLGVVEFTKESAAFLREVAGANNYNAYVDAFPFKPTSRDEQRLETTLRVKQLLEEAPKSAHVSDTQLEQYADIISARKGLDDLIQKLKNSNALHTVVSVNLVIRKWVKQHFAVDKKGHPLDDEAKTLLLQIRGAIYPKNIAHGLGLLEFTKSSADFLRDLAKKEQVEPDVFYNAFIYQPEKNDLLKEHVLRSRQLGQQAEKITLKKHTPKVQEPKQVSEEEWQFNLDKIEMDLQHQPFNEQFENYINKVAKTDGATPQRLLKTMGAYLHEYAKEHFADYSDDSSSHPINLAFYTYSLDAFKQHFSIYDLADESLEQFYNYDFGDHLRNGHAAGLLTATTREAGKEPASPVKAESFVKADPLIGSETPVRSESPVRTVAPAKPEPVRLPSSAKAVSQQINSLLENINTIIMSQQREKTSKRHLARRFKKALEPKNERNHKVLMGYYISSIKSAIASIDVIAQAIKTPVEFIEAIQPMRQFLHNIEITDIKEININGKNQKGIKDLAKELNHELTVRANDILNIARADARNAINALSDAQIALEKLNARNASPIDIEYQANKVADFKSQVEKRKENFYLIEAKIRQNDSVLIKPAQKEEPKTKTSSLQRAKELLHNPPIISHLQKKIKDMQAAQKVSKQNRKEVSKEKKNPRKHH